MNFTVNRLYRTGKNLASDFFYASAFYGGNFNKLILISKKKFELFRKELPLLMLDCLHIMMPGHWIFRIIITHVHVLVNIKTSSD